jgi:hypothetical protein
MQYPKLSLPEALVKPSTEALNINNYRYNLWNLTINKNNSEGVQYKNTRSS